MSSNFFLIYNIFFKALIPSLFLTCLLPAPPGSPVRWRWCFFLSKEFYEKNFKNYFIFITFLKGLDNSFLLTCAFANLSIFLSLSTFSLWASRSFYMNYKDLSAKGEFISFFFLLRKVYSLS